MTSTAGKNIYVLNGPTLNLLGTREPEVYGTTTLADIEAMLRERADTYGFNIDFRQSQHEGELVGWILESREKANGLVFNPAAYSHTSVALHDALLAAETPAIEVHISNIYKRESFRHHSCVSMAVLGVICGLGAHGYVLALDALAHHLNTQ